MDPATAAEPPRRAGPARRQVLLRGLLGAGLLAASPLLAGCGIELGDIRWDDGAPAPTPTPGADELARRRAVASAQSLLAACTAAGAVRPDLRAVLDLLVEQHRDHLVALGTTPEPAPSGLGSSTPTPPTTPPATSATAVPTTTAPTAGSDPVGDLTAGHTAAASEAMTDTAGTSGPLAMLLAQVAACRAVQARRLATALGAAAPPDPAPASAPQPATTGSPTTSGTSSPPSPSSPAPPTVERTPSPEVTEALQAAVEGEHAAVYGYGVLAAKLTGAQRRQAVADLAAHEDVAEQLSGVLDRAGLQVPPAAPAYRLDEPVTGAGQAVALAARLESSLAALDAALVASSTGELRTVAVDLLLARGLAAYRWGAAPTAFPGSL